MAAKQISFWLDPAAFSCSSERIIMGSFIQLFAPTYGMFNMKLFMADISRYCTQYISLAQSSLA